MRRLLLALVCAGCNAAWGIEPADSLLVDSGPGPADTEKGACDPEPGVAKVCLTFKAPAHPAYDVTTGAATHRIDGLGTIRIDVFDQDPSDPAAPYVQRVKLPLAGGELKIDELPTTWASEIGAGKHWIIAQFEDNKTLARTGENFYQAGDFVTVPTRAPNGRLVWPSFDAVVDQTARLELTLQPLRRVDVELQADASLRTTYKDFAVNGDGPVTFALFDGELMPSTVYLELISVGCHQAMPLTLMPPLLKTHFTTTVTGNHKILASLEDYDNTSAFPTSGSLLTPDVMAPSMEISSTSWTASHSAKFVKVLNPYRAGEKVDALKCP